MPLHRNFILLYHAIYYAHLKMFVFAAYEHSLGVFSVKDATYNLCKFSYFFRVNILSK
jgi:hypothetical protein